MYASLPSAFRRMVFAVAASLGPACAVGACGGIVVPASDASTDASAGDGSAPSADGGPCAPVVTRTSSCSARVTWTCGAPSELTESTEPRGLPNDFCEANCPAALEEPAYLSCFTYGPDGGVTWLGCGYCASGRRTEGFVEPAALDSVDPVAAYLATCATLEAGSVTAFERLACELRAHGAPVTLLEELARAADEERVHTRAVTRAAVARGALPAEPVIEPGAPRSLFALARENAVEGCVRETYGALVAAWQHAHARDESLAGLYALLAEDEARHAELSWRMDAWLHARLTDAERDEVRRARERAVRELELDARAPVHPTLVRDAGLPDAAAKQALLRALHGALWA